VNSSDSTGLTREQFIKASCMVYEFTHQTKLEWSPLLNQGNHQEESLQLSIPDVLSNESASGIEPS
jgi:hypothetical protein